MKTSPSQTPDSQRKYRLRWKAEGRCSSCGGERPEGRLLRCPRCSGRTSADAKHTREDRLIRKVCVRCVATISAVGRKTCDRCRRVTWAAAKQKPSYASEYRKQKYQELRDEVFQAYGGYACACCGETEPKFLCIDHVNGGGNLHRKEKGVRSGIYHWLRRMHFPPGFRVLCQNCNWGRDQNGGVCPHVAKTP